MKGGIIQVAISEFDRKQEFIAGTEIHSYDFAIFEMGSIFRSSQKLVPAVSPDLTKRPDQKINDEIFAYVQTQGYHVAGLLVGKTENENWQGKARAYNWQDAIAFAQDVLQLCNLEWSVARSDLAPWHPGRCAELIVNGKAVAHAGELHRPHHAGSE